MTSKIFVFGSCVSRDIFNFDDNNRYELVDYRARSSLGSCFTPSSINDIEIDRLSSSFQRRIVKTDIEASFPTLLKEADFDILLLDLIDERFDLYVDESGGVCTLSNELYATGFKPASRNGNIVASGSDDFIKMWLIGWCKLVSSLRTHGKLGRLHINEVYWSQKSKDGMDYLPNYSKEKIEQANKSLEILYSHIRLVLPESQILKVDPSLFIGANSHQWGRSPFHYEDNYYHEMLDKLEMSTPYQARIDITNKKNSAYDASGWDEQIYEYDNLPNALKSGLSYDGIHSVSLAKNQLLDICIKGTEKLNSIKGKKVMLIGLTGAISSRNGKKAPFFSGLGIAESLNLPIASISDPTLSLDKNIPLAWYAGNENSPDLPIKLAEVLEHLADIHQARLLIFGGSGGGYAALMLASLIKCNASVLVWNPQTSISDYAPGFVQEYLYAAFPRKSGRKNDHVDISSNALREEMDSLKIIHNIRNLSLGSNIELVYLQNQTDWHLARHAGPYINSKTWSRIGKATFCNKNEKSIISFGEWGKGHAIPPKSLIKLVISKIAERTGIKEIAKSLDDGIDGILDAPSPLVWFNADTHFHLKTEAIVDGAWIRAQSSINPTEKEMDSVMYAFYLLKDDQRIADRWYEAKNDVVFDIENLEGKLEVVAFAQDQLGSKLITRTPVNLQS